MTSPVPVQPSWVTPDAIMRSNPWSRSFTFPTTDSNGNALNWTGSTFSVNSRQVASSKITLAVTGPAATPTVTISISGADTATISADQVYWYLSENIVYGGVQFLAGRIDLKGKQ